jgi:hypothetical protein
MTEEIRGLGPLNWRKNWIEKDLSPDEFDKIAKEHAEAMEVPA